MCRLKILLLTYEVLCLHLGLLCRWCFICFCSEEFVSLEVCKNPRDRNHDKLQRKEAESVAPPSGGRPAPPLDAGCRFTHWLQSSKHFYTVKNSRQHFTLWVKWNKSNQTYLKKLIIMQKWFLSIFRGGLGCQFKICIFAFYQNKRGSFPHRTKSCDWNKDLISRTLRNIKVFFK